METQKIAHYRPLAELMPKVWQSGSVETATNVHIHYTRTGGTRLPVILLHGFQTAGITWMRTAEALAGYDVIMPDFRGHGLSSGIEQGFSAELLTEDIATLIHALKLDQAFVVGHSMGGEIAGRLAATHPELVRAVVLVDPPLHPFNLPPVDLDNPPPWLQPMVSALRSIKSQSHEQRLVTMQALLAPGSAQWDEIDYVTSMEAAAQFDLKTFNARVDYQLATVDMIKRITCPMLLMTSRGMPGTDVAQNVKVLTDNWLDGAYVHFADSGHFIMADQFERFIEVLTNFLSDN
ncbi:MAG: alpha/beta hydrolase [Anaerolineae bacterium]|nr:alpha/beta hydrolase [Anaerolineae bacterium]